MLFPLILFYVCDNFLVLLKHWFFLQHKTLESLTTWYPFTQPVTQNIRVTQLFKISLTLSSPCQKWWKQCIIRLETKSDKKRYVEFKWDVKVLSRLCEYIWSFVLVVLQYPEMYFEQSHSSTIQWFCYINMRLWILCL